MKYKISQYARIHHVCKKTVWNWINAGKVKYERDVTNHVWIVEDEPQQRKNAAVYARVSSNGQKEDLDRQADRVLKWATINGYSVCKVVKEIGSGLNDKRVKLEKLITDKSIDYIIVEHKDRLARFGINYITQLMKAQDREVIIINDVEDDKSDLIQDFVSIITSFCARLYGQRRSKRTTEKLLENLISEEDKTQINTVEE